VTPTILAWLGADIPNQVDGWPLTPWIEQGARPEHWRSEAHFEWDFRNPALKLGESYFGIPSAHCLLNVVRSDRYKYVQFAAESDILPPLLFDLGADPGELADVSRSAEYASAAWEAAQKLLRADPRQPISRRPPRARRVEGRLALSPAQPQPKPGNDRIGARCDRTISSTRPKATASDASM
jgi:arylsulfatase A-like enzyme